MIPSIADAVSHLASFYMLALLVVGVILGLVIGALPGLTVTMATSLLASLTYGWELYHALALIIGVYVGGVAGGAVSAILLNVPGTPAAIATTFDGYPLTLRGEGGQALGVSAIASFIGCIFGIGILAVASPFISSFALSFGPPEMLFLAVLAMTLVGSLAGSAAMKGLISATFGVLFALVGLDQIYGVPRFNYGSVDLTGGLHFIPSLIGLLGMSEILLQLRLTDHVKIVPKIKTVLPDITTLRACSKVLWRSLGIGIFVGGLPGIGGETANLVAYGQAKKSVKNPTRPFGKGAYEGVAASELSANSCIGGDWIPMLTLGIPGDATTAVIMAVLFIHGLQPGPLLLTHHPHLLWFVVLGSFVASVVMVTTMLGGARLLARIVLIPKKYLMPIVFVLCVAGAYAFEQRMFHVYQMFAFGVLGLLMRWLGFPISPMILGIILGEMMDSELRRSLILSQGDFLGMVWKRPISLVLALVIVGTLSFTLWQSLRRAPAASPVSSDDFRDQS